MGITLKQLTDTVSQIKDYILNKTHKIDQISYAQKTVNTELDYGVFEVTDMTINKTTPLIFSNVNSGNMELSENGYIKLQKDKTYVFHTGLYKADYNRGIALVDSELNVLTDFNTTSVGSYIYEAKEDIEVTFIVSDSGSISVSSKWGCVNVYEINRQIVIDPVEYVNQHDGIEDTPVGHIISHMGTTAPKHYLICNGAVYNIVDYPYLAQHMIDNFGKVNYFGGNGTTTFAVPDLRGEFLRGSGTATRKTGSGAAVGVHQDGTRHQNFYVGAASLCFYGDVTTGANNSDRNITNTTNGKKINYSTYSSSSNAQYFNSRPTNTSVLYCIKYEPTYFMNTYNTNYMQPSMYSEEERIVGCWIDGKPLYQKTISFGAITAQHIDIPVNIENIEIAMITDGYVYDVVNLSFYPISYTNSLFTQYSNTAFVVVENNVATLSIRKSNEQTISNGYITIQYTKTTDAENSFTDDMIQDYIIQSSKSEPYSEEEVTNAVNEIWQ